METFKGLEISIEKMFGLGFIIDFDGADPTFISIAIGPFLIDINRWRYWKNYWKKSL